MAYSKTVWNNNTPPDISAENLNKMEQGIYDAQFPDGGSTGQILSKTNDGTGWVDAPTSAEWGNITGQLSEQTDLYSELESKITLPSGGTTGQVLTKTASGQAWDDVDGLPAGGTAGQVLTKNSSTDGDASWQTSPSGGGGTWGYISGTLTDQTDLVAALDAKANTSTLATVESTSTASQEYSVGDYLVYNGILYKVISAINSGETLTPNTNIEATTTGAELTSLNKSLTTLGKPVLIGTSATNPPLTWSNFNLSEPISNFSYLIIELRRNISQNLASVTVHVDDLTASESWVAIYVTSNWRFSMKYKKVSDTVMSAATDERAGFDGYLKVYGVR